MPEARVLFIAACGCMLATRQRDQVASRCREHRRVREAQLTQWWWATTAIRLRRHG